MKHLSTISDTVAFIFLSVLVICTGFLVIAVQVQGQISGGSGGTTITSFCGDGKLDPNETCDDGNTINGDGCSNQCLVETSGSSSSTGTSSGGTSTTTSQCGNGIQNTGEQCDNVDFGGASCQTFGFTDGTLRCSGQCTFDTSDCVTNTTTGPTVLPVCGNNIIEGTENCDGKDLGGRACSSFGFTDGTVVCTSVCRFDTGQCRLASGSTANTTNSNTNTAAPSSGTSGGSGNTNTSAPQTGGTGSGNTNTTAGAQSPAP
ncbi:MAG: DUF4215 domain-containing protein, partial [Patescibacteria group bacterium]